jgi:hypothetical protein
VDRKVVGYFKIIFQNFPGRCEKKYGYITQDICLLADIRTGCLPTRYRCGMSDGTRETDSRL